jgi:hypothetical protein
VDTGSVTVVATVTPGTGSGKTAVGTAADSITLQPIATVTIVPASVSVPFGQPNPVLTVEARRAGGLPARGRLCNLLSSNAFLATVPGSGVTGSDGNLAFTVTRVLFPGTVTITATCEGIPGTSSVTFQ